MIETEAAQYVISNFELVARIILAVIMGGLIGIEREYSNRPAGLRTHILVSVGSALIMLVSMYGFNYGDPARLAAQVVSGIGFLGAGTIIRNGNNVKGLTTAASLWVCAGIGLAIGNGYYFGAITTTTVVVITLFLLRFLERKLPICLYRKITLICTERAGLVGDVGSCLGDLDIGMDKIKLKRKESIDNLLTIELVVKLSNKNQFKTLLSELNKIKGIEQISNSIE